MLSRMTRTRFATTASMSITCAAMIAAALFIATAHTGTEMTTPTARPVGANIARSSTNTAIRPILFFMARVCGISAWSSKSTTAVNSNAQKLLDIANANAENLYIKTDGSLDEGLELVTHPMTLEYQLNEMPWAEVLRKAQSMGYLSHAAGTCGLHVHISRLAFGCTYEQQEAAIARLLYFVEKFWAELLRFSRRTQSQMNRWAARYGIRLTPSEQMSHAKNSCAGRYTAVNLTNADTVEIRMFRGTLKLNTLKATLQMVNHLVEVAVSMSDSQVQDMSWFDFLDNITEPELIQYLKERRLYVNEPVSASEEE